MSTCLCERRNPGEALSPQALGLPGAGVTFAHMAPPAAPVGAAQSTGGVFDGVRHKPVVLPVTYYRRNTMQLIASVKIYLHAILSIPGTSAHAEIARSG